MSKSAHDTITTTDLVRNLAGVIDEVRLSGHSLTITKGRQTVAELSPPPKAGLPVNELSKLIESLPRLGTDAPSMANDIETIRGHAVLPENPWT